MAHDDRQLLQRFLRSRSSDDFAPLVDRYLNLVWSTARKASSLENGPIEDICQTVFADLARKAERIPEATPVAGWLYRHTCFVASNFNRSERRRRERERQALEMSEPDSSPDIPNEELHLAMNELPDQDRDALVLRFLDEWDLRRVGERLGISEDAAQKRVARALDKLRSILGSKGITATTATLAICLGQQVSAAPLIAKAVAMAAVGSATTAPALLTLMKAPLVKLAAIVVIGGGLAASMHHQHRQVAALQQHNDELAFQVAALLDLQAENEALKKQNLSADEIAALRKKADEVHALRAEIGKLRQAMRDRRVPVTTNPAPSKQPVTTNAAPSGPQILIVTKLVGRSDEAPDAIAPEMLRKYTGGAAVLPRAELEQVLGAATAAPGFDVLSAPRMVTVDGREAQIQVGQSTTIVTGYFTRANGEKIEALTTNIFTGITADLEPTVQADGIATLLNVRVQITTFDGYLEKAVKKRKIKDDLWFHETVPIVDIAESNTRAAVNPGHSILLPSKSKLTGKQYWAFITPTFIDPAGNEISPPGLRSQTDTSKP